jgi:hypothetical protein
MRVMRPWPWARLKMMPTLYLRSVPGLEALIGGHPGPLAEEVDVAGVVHLVDEVGAAGAAADLAEDGLALGGEEPLHVGEAVPMLRAFRAHCGPSSMPGGCSRGWYMSRTVMMTGLIHSMERISMGFGR